MAETRQYDVAIIGMGPVGLTLANFMGLLGLRACALDRREVRYPLPRAVTFDDEVMRIFQMIGLTDQIEAITEIGKGAKFVDGAGQVLVNWDRPMERTENGWFVNYRFFQPELEATLLDGLDRFATVDTVWGAEVTGLSPGADAVGVTYDGSDGLQEIEAQYVVGCDGGRSFTRKSIGAQSIDLGFHEDWLIVDLVLPTPDPAPDPHTYHYCGTQRMGSQIFAGARRKRFEFRLNPGDDPATIGEPAQVWPMLQSWITPQQAKLERTTVYTFHSTLARDWHRGRCLIAGDAAHQTPPFMGQGMCAGIRDAANLAWKLDRVIRQRAGEAWLTSYQTERAPHVEQYIRLTIQLGRMISQTAQSVQAGNMRSGAGSRQEMSQLRPALGPGLTAGDTAQRGRLFAQPRLSTGQMLDDAIGYRPALLLGPGDAAEVPAAFAAQGIAVIADPALEPWLNGAAAVLLRPDRYVLGSVASAAQLSHLLPEQWQIEGPEC